MLKDPYWRKELVITSTNSEINSGKIYLPDFDDKTKPVIKVNNVVYPYDTDEVIKSVVESEKTLYYVDLTKLPANANISISYKSL